MSTINEVRQILMNELGLTRESIREVVREIVTDTVEKHLRNMTSQSEMERIIRDKVNEVVKDNRWEKDTMRDLIIHVARTEIEKFVASHIKIATQKRKP